MRDLDPLRTGKVNFVLGMGVSLGSEQGPQREFPVPGGSVTWTLPEFPLSYPRISKHFANTSGCPRRGRSVSPQSPRAVGTGESQDCPWWWRRNKIQHGETALALPTLNWSSQPGWLDTGTGMTSLPTPGGSGTPRTLMGATLRSLTSLGITPQELAAAGPDASLQPLHCGFRDVPCGNDPFRPRQTEIPWIRGSSKQGAPAFPPHQGQERGLAEPVGVSV